MVFKKGYTPWNLGKPFSLKVREQMSRTRKGTRLGPLHPLWKGGYQNTLMLNRKRRVFKLNAGGSHTLADWETLKAQYNWTCPCCGKSEPIIVLTEDHIIPLSKGGSDNIENIQPLCRSCNSKKHDKIIKYINL